MYTRESVANKEAVGTCSYIQVAFRSIEWGDSNLFFAYCHITSCGLYLLLGAPVAAPCSQSAAARREMLAPMHMASISSQPAEAFARWKGMDGGRGWAPMPSVCLAAMLAMSSHSIAGC